MADICGNQAELFRKVAELSARQAAVQATPLAEEKKVPTVAVAKAPPKRSEPKKPSKPKVPAKKAVVAKKPAPKSVAKKPAPAKAAAKKARKNR